MLLNKDSLLKLLKEGGYHSTVIASYSYDPLFLDRILSWRLRSSGSLNNTFLVDANTFRKGLSVETDIGLDAGRSYSVVPIKVDGAFHPKIIIQFGEKKGRIFLGSANASTAGFGNNLEVMAEIRCDLESTYEKDLIYRCFSFLNQFLEDRAKSIEYRIQRIFDDTPWFKSYANSPSIPESPDGLPIQLLLSGDESIFEQIVNIVGERKVNRIYAIAPFWDEKLNALDQFIKRFSPGETIVGLQPDTVSLNSKAISKLSGPISFIDLGIKERYLHAKVFLFQCKDKDYLITGSANCSIAALGAPRKRSKNIEACLCHVFKSGEGIKNLSLDKIIGKKKPLSKDKISQLQNVDGDNGAPEGNYNSDYFELLGKNIHWYPSSPVNENIKLVLLDSSRREITVIGNPTLSDDEVVFHFEDAHTLDVRYVCTIDGEKKSPPAILNNYYEVVKSAPGIAAGKLAKIFNDIQYGNSNIIDLLTPLENMIFSDNSSGGKEEGSSGRGGQSKSKDGSEDKPADQGKPLPYDEFIQGIESGKGKVKNIFSTDDIQLSMLLEFLTELFQINKPADDVDETLANEDDDDFVDQLDDVEEDKPDSPNDVDPKIVVSTQSALNRVRNKINNILKKYRGWISSKKEIVDIHDISSFWALILVVCYLSEISVIKEDNEIEKIIPKNEAEDDFSFVQIIRDALGLFIDGDKPPLGKLHIIDQDTVFPKELLGIYTAICWSLCSAMAYSYGGRQTELVQDLETLGYQAYIGVEKLMSLVKDFSLKNELANIYTKLGVDDIPVDSILKCNDWYSSLASKTLAPSGFKVDVERKDCSKYSNGMRVWTANKGPRYIRNVTEKNVELNWPGHDEQNCIKAYVCGAVAQLEPSDYAPLEALKK